MLSERIEFRDIDGVRFTRLSRLLWSSESEPPRPPPIVLFLRRGAQIVAVLHTRRGRVPLEEVGEGDLEAMTKRLEARLGVSVELDAFRRIHESASGATFIGDDLADLILNLVVAGEREKIAGDLELWPDVFEGIKPPTRRALQQVFDTILPANSSILFYVFDGTSLDSEIIISRGERDIVLIGGHDSLQMGPPPRQWRRDYRRLLEAAERRVGGAALGVFVEKETALAVIRGEPRGDISKALGRRDLIIDPFPVWLAGPLGAAAMKSVVSAGRRAGEQLVERVKPKGFAGRLAGRMAGKVAGRVRSRVSEGLKRTGAAERVEQTVGMLKKRVDLGDFLGFDPFRLGRRIGEVFGASRSGADDAEDEGSSRDH